MYNLAMIKNILFILVLLFYTGCEFDLFNDKKVEQLQDENMKLKAHKEAEATQLKYKNSLVKIEKSQELEQLKLESELKKVQLENSKELEKIALENALKKEQIEKEKALELEVLRQKTALAEAEKALELKKYLFAVLALIIIIIAFFIYYYLKRKREDKLIAYNDNLKKYFRYKESETRTRIAEKVLDTIAEGKLSKEDQANLIKAISSSEALDEQMTPNEIENIEVEMIETRQDDKT